jgi:CheY-like chemotaxis protein
MQIEDKNAENRQPVIMYADDDKICLDVSVQMLQRLGYTVLKAIDGKEAVEVYKNNQEKIDLVILDMVMPYNGGRTFEQLKKNKFRFKNHAYKWVHRRLWYS